MAPCRKFRQGPGDPIPEYVFPTARRVSSTDRASGSTAGCEGAGTQPLNKYLQDWDGVAGQGEGVNLPTVGGTGALLPSWCRVAASAVAKEIPAGNEMQSETAGGHCPGSTGGWRCLPSHWLSRQCVVGWQCSSAVVDAVRSVGVGRRALRWTWPTP